MAKVKFMAKAHGDQQEVDVNLDLLRASNEKGMDLKSYVNNEFPTEASTDTFTQLCANSGLIFNANKDLGIVPPTLHGVFGATANTGDAYPASRILFPAATLSAVDEKMEKDLKSPVVAFDKLVATTTTVQGARAEQPVISYDTPGGPEEARAQRIAQGAKPATMMLISAKDTTRTIPTLSLGIEVTDQALQGTTLDFLAMTIARQRTVAAFKNAGDAMSVMIDGDTNNGTSALVAKKASSFDSSIDTAGKLTHLAWMKFLYEDILQRQIDWVIVDSLETALAIEGREGKPTINTDDPNSPRIDTLFNTAYPTLSANVQMFIAPKEWGLASGTILGIQSNYAMAKIENSLAKYEAYEKFVLNRTSAMRFDFGVDYYRVYDEAFSLMTIASV